MTFRLPFGMPALKIALGAFLVSGAGLVGLQQLGAQAITGHDSNAPVNYAADRIELQDKAKRVVLSGNVAISQGDLQMRAGRTTVAYTDTDPLKIQRLDATGGVTVTRGPGSPRGDVAGDSGERGRKRQHGAGHRRPGDSHARVLVHELERRGVARRAGGGPCTAPGSTPGAVSYQSINGDHAARRRTQRAGRAMAVRSQRFNGAFMARPLCADLVLALW